MSAVTGKPLGSLRAQLLRWLLIPLALLVGINAVSVYRNAVDAADTAYDRSLLASTRALAERVSVAGGKVVANVPYVALDNFETDTLGRIYYRVTGIDGEFVSGYEDLPALPRDVPRSEAYPALVHFYNASYRGQALRIAALRQPVFDESIRGIALIQVGESLDARQGLSRRILLDTLWRQAVLVLTAALLAWLAVRLALRPLARLTADVQSRAPADLSDFAPGLVQRELRPLVTAMNAYRNRLHGLIAGQSRFIADASHQLRTPLAVLKTQTELALRELERTNDPRAVRELLGSIAQTTDAGIHLSNRLLALARAEQDVPAERMGLVSLTDLVQQVALELAPAAVAKDIELSLEAPQQVTISGQDWLLHELAANLVDNAIRYTPSGGHIVLRVYQMSADQGGQAMLEVEDSGVGIAAAERSQVFTPFYRCGQTLETNPGGAGLGLAIVRDIAASHRARIQLADGMPNPASGRAKKGLKVTVAFPAAV